MHRLTVSVFVSALVFILPARADAQEQQEAVVSLRDIDTATEGGADRALHRIRRAAQDVCDAIRALRAFDDRIAARTCVREAMTRAVDDLGDPIVAARFNGRRLYARRGERS